MSADRDDDALVAAVLSGDRDAFGVLVGRHRAYLHGVALRTLGAGHDAVEDSVQDAWLLAYRHLAEYEPRDRFRGWLATICHNRCVARARRRHFVTVVLDELPPRADHAPGPEAAALTAELGAALAAAPGAIPRDQAGAVLLCDRDGLTYDESAAILGIPRATVATRLHRGRQRLRGLLAGV